MSPILSRDNSFKHQKRTEMYRAAAEEQRRRWEEDGRYLVERGSVDETRTGREVELEGGEELKDEGIRIGTRLGGHGDEPEDAVESSELIDRESLEERLRGSPDEMDDLGRTSNDQRPITTTGDYPPAVPLSPSTPSLSFSLALSLFTQSTPSLLLSLLGLIFTGQLLDHLARWHVFHRVDELFILVPVLGNLKGNLETVLGARLATAANQGHLDHPSHRRSRITTSLTLVLFQALSISFLASILSFLLGLLTNHRVINPADVEDWGYTRPGLKEAGFVVAVGMGTAGASTAVLGGFMSSLVVVARWWGVDPDNIVPPLAACLGDLITLFLLALMGAGFVKLIDVPPVVGAAVLLVCVGTVAVGLVVRRQSRKETERAQSRRRGGDGSTDGKAEGELEQGGWAPLIGAMIIASAAGLVLGRSVGAFKGYALLVIGLTGISGGIGAIYASRYSTTLHLQGQSHRPRSRPQPAQLTPLQGGLTLFAASIPVNVAFIAFVKLAGWTQLDRQLLCTFVVAYQGTVAISLALAHWMTRWCWSRRLDPDSYVLPLHSAFIDVVGQCLLVTAFQAALWMGGDVETAPIEG